MPRHKKTWDLIDAMYVVLEEHHPMTVRQVYYQLVSKQIIKNEQRQYSRVSRYLVEARKDGIIPWEWVEDRMRRPRTVSMWASLSRFAETVLRSYRRNVWTSQPEYIECWLEKDALSGIFEEILWPYGVTLNVGRGYDGWSSIRNAAERYVGRDVIVLYFGDFDPSGEDIARSLQERLDYFECAPHVITCALLEEDVAEYNLPFDFTKGTDSRQAAFVEKYGDVAVELDALPINVLSDRIRDEVEARMDLDMLETVKYTEQQDRSQLTEILKSLKA